MEVSISGSPSDLATVGGTSEAGGGRQLPWTLLADRWHRGRLGCRPGRESMITGAHVILYSTDAASDRDVLLDVRGTRAVDAVGSRLILALPPSEIAVHPTDEVPRHEMYLMCDDIVSTMSCIAATGVRFA